MAGDGVRGEPFREEFRPALGDACAEDSDIWALYGNDFGPAGFDASLDSYLAKPDACTFVLFAGDEINMTRWAIERYGHGADIADMLHLIGSRSASKFVTFDHRIAKSAGAGTPVPVETLR